jgi:regulator of sirC expression with transglutaminase-like and TPR domain
MLFPEASFELRDRGLLYYQLGQFSQAMEDLQIYLIKVPDAKDADVIRQLLAKLN